MKVYLNYDKQNSTHPDRLEFTSGHLLSESLKEFFTVIDTPDGADLVLNTVPYNQAEPFIKGKTTFIYDNESPYNNQADWIYYSTEKKLGLPNSSLLMDATIPSYKYYPSEFEYEVGFLGRQYVRERLDLIKRLSEKFKILNGALPLGEVSARQLSKAKLLLIIDDYKEMHEPIDWIDRRLFTWGNIRPLLVPFNKDYLLVGKPGAHYIPYSDFDSLVEKIKYYLVHMDEAEKIGNNLKKELKNHTYRHRAREIYNKYKSLYV